MRPDQSSAFPTRGSYQPVRHLAAGRSTTTTNYSSSSSAERRPAHAAGGQLSTAARPTSFAADDTSRSASALSSAWPTPPTLRELPLRSNDMPTLTDAHFLSSSAVPPCLAHSADKGNLAHSSSYASVNWHSLRPARTEAQDESRTPGGSTDTYEARTQEIMQFIWDLSDNYDRLQALASSLHPYPEDSYQRLTQLYTSVREIVEELRYDTTQYTLAMGDWDVLNTEHLSEDSPWTRHMLKLRQQFFEDPDFNPKQLDEKQMDLLDYYCRLQQRIEDIIQERDEAAQATRPSNRMAHTAVDSRVMSASQQECATIRLQSQPPPTDATTRHQNNLGMQQPAPQQPGWTTGRGGAHNSSPRRLAHTADVAPAPGLAAHPAASNQGGGELFKPIAQPAQPSQDRLKAMMSSYAGTGPQLSYSGPLQVGADGKPFSGSSADAKPQPSASGTTTLSHGSSSAFVPYRSATNQRQTSSDRRPPDRYCNYMADTQVIEAQCAFCSGPHWPSQCPRYDTTNKRFRRVLKLNYCLLCLKGGHHARMCPKKSGEPCRHCGHGEHHQALCKDLQRRRKELRTEPMRANKKELATSKKTPGAPSVASPRVNLGGPSSPSRLVRQSWYSRQLVEARPPGGSTVKTSRLPSAQISYALGTSNSTISEIQPSQDSRTDPDGLPGTDSPTTAINKSVTSKGAYASGPAEYLLQQQNLRATDRRSTTDGMVQFGRTPGGGSRLSVPRIAETPDGPWSHELHNEDVSPNQPSGLYGGELGRPIAETTPRFEKTHKSKDEDKTPLLQCLIAKVKNPWTDDSVEAVIVFDHLRTFSVISKELVRALKLPAASTPTADFDTFTGYNTSIDLFTPEGVRITIDQPATGRLPKLVRTVIIDEKLLTALRRNRMPLNVTHAQPHLLIGADELLRLRYRHGPRLREGLFSVHTILGVALGGSLQVDTDSASSKASNSWPSSSSTATSTADAEDTSLHYRRLRPSQRTTPFSLPPPWLQKWTAYRLAHTADDTAVPTLTSSAYCPAHPAGSTTAYGNNEHLEPSTSTSSTSGHRPSLPEGSGVQPRSPQKQSSKNPLDAKLLLLPTSTTTYVEVEEVSMAHTAVRPPRPIQEPFCSAEKPLERRTPPPPAHGDLIGTAPYDAGLTLKRKTRLRYRLPEFARHILGLYAAPEPVSTLVLLFHLEPTFLHLLRAERDVQLVLLPSLRLPLPLILIRHRDAVQHHTIFQFCAVLIPGACAAVQFHMRNQADVRYVEAEATLQFIKAAPLKNIVVQSGAFNPDGEGNPMQPTHLTAAADNLKRITGTPALVYLENTALNAVRLYQLNAGLLDRTLLTEDPSAGNRVPIENLRQHIHTVLPRAATIAAPAARADRADQEEQMEHSPADRPAHTAGGQLEGVAQIVPSVPPPPAPAPSIPPSPPAERRSASHSPRDEVSKKDAIKTRGIRDRSRSLSSRSGRSNSSLSTSSSSSGSHKPAPSDNGAKNLRESLESMLKHGLGKMVKGVSPPRRTRRSRSRSRDETDRRSRSRSRDKRRKRSRSRSRRSRSSSKTSGLSGRRKSESSRHSGRSGDKGTSSDADRRRDRVRKRDDERRRDDRHPDDLQRDLERRRQDRLREDERRKREDQRKSHHRRSKERSPQDKDRHKKDSGEGDRHSRSARPTPPTDRRVEPSPSNRDASTSRRDASPKFARPAIPADRKLRKQVRAPTPDTRDASLASSSGSFRTSTPDTSMASTRVSSALSRVYDTRQRQGVMIPVATSTARTDAAPYQSTSRKERRPAHTAGGIPAVRRDSNNSLFKTHPLPPAWTLRPSEEDINSFTDEIFGEEEDPTLRIRAVALSELRSQTIDPPAQPETFAVPPERTWNPEEQCTRAAEERPCFHPTVKTGKWINLKRWKTTPAFKDPALLKMLYELGDMKIYTLGHHIILSWAVRLKNKDDRVRFIVAFLHRLLQTFDWAQGIPALIAEFQPLMLDEDSRTPWPEFFHFKQGAERWVSTCEFAYRYLFDHLSGPLRFRPSWLQTANVDADFRSSINDEMLNRASEMFNELRHVIYRQYGLRHIRAELSRETIYWEPFSSSPNRDSTRHGRLLVGQTVVFAEEPVYHAFSPMLRNEVEIIALRDGNRASIRNEVFNCFPSDSVNRVVFWLGRNYIVEGNYDDFDKLIQEMCHVYAKYFGAVEVFVVLPPYARTHRARWMSQVLRLLVEQEDLLPFARVALYTSDIQLYDRDRRLGVSAPWPAAIGTSEDGRYLTDYTVESRKKYLMTEHGLDLWQSYPKASMKTAHRLIDYSSTPIPDAARVNVDYTSAPPTRPDSAASTATSTSASAGPSAAARPTPPAAQTLQPAPTTIVQAYDAPSTSAASAGPDIQTTISAVLQQQAQLFQQQQEQHNQQLQRMMDLIASQAAALQPPPRSKKPRRRDKDQYSDHSD